MNINPWLGEVIIGFRQRHSNEELRAAYRRYAEHSPHVPWDVFIAEKALSEEMKLNPFLATRRKDMGLPENTTDFLNANSVDTVADLLQITEEEFKEIFEAREDEIPPIRKYLQDHGLHLYHSDKFTWKVGTDEVKEEKDRLKETLDAARQRAGTESMPPFTLSWRIIRWPPIIMRPLHGWWKRSMVPMRSGGVKTFALPQYVCPGYRIMKKRWNCSS